jgi:hypothetical protein
VFGAQSAGAAAVVQDIRTHYSSLIIPGLFLGLVEFFSINRRRPGIGRILLIWLLVCASGSALARGPLPGAVGNAQWKLTNPKEKTYREALAMIPADARVSVSSQFSPHLTRRTALFEFPNPFQPYMYGEFVNRSGEPEEPNPLAKIPVDQTTKKSIDWIAVDLDDLHKYSDLFEGLRSPGSEFQTVFEKDRVVVARRIVRP